MSQQSLNPDTTEHPPGVTFESITFSDGKTLTLEQNEIVVLVGPNNAGKSVALRELHEHISGTANPLVAKSVEFRRQGTLEDFLRLLKQHAEIRNHGANYSIQGEGFGFNTHTLNNTWPENFWLFHPLFCVRIDTETRIQDSNQVNAIDVNNQRPTHPTHWLYADDQLELRISNYFERAYGQALIVDQRAGSRIPLWVGKRLIPEPLEDRLSSKYWERVRSTSVLLEKQGDGMRSFASVILHLLAPTTPSVLLLDEPEAFLHPPQARLLGEIIATEKPSNTQLFVATHSTDVLQGMMEVAPDHMRVIRIQREGNINRTKELDKDLIQQISRDPLMKYSSVMSGLFHERVIICESDSDCMLYSSLLDIPTVHQGHNPDVLFVHANGKHRMAALAQSLRALDIPVDVIADIDIMRNQSDLQKLVEVLGGDWQKAEPLVKSIRNAIEQSKPNLDSREVRETIGKILEEAPSSGEFPRDLRRRIEDTFPKASRWEFVKTTGQAAIPPGNTTRQFQELQQLCNQIGLWIVHVGQLEGFCRSISEHGPRWVQSVLDQRDLAEDPELKEAREFMHKIWDSKTLQTPGVRSTEGAEAQEPECPPSPTPTFSG